MIEPNDIFIELRIYQNDEISIHEPSPEHISRIMEKIVDFDLKIESFKVGGFW
jgi:PP-loop superfamily ATP-utilizing enzyme